MHKIDTEKRELKAIKVTYYNINMEIFLLIII